VVRSGGRLPFYHGNREGVGNGRMGCLPGLGLGLRSHEKNLSLMLPQVRKD